MVYGTRLESERFAKNRGFESLYFRLNSTQDIAQRKKRRFWEPEVGGFESPYPENIDRIAQLGRANAF